MSNKYKNKVNTETVDGINAIDNVEHTLEQQELSFKKEEPKVEYNAHAFSIIESTSDKDGSSLYAAVEIPFNSKTLQVGDVRVIEKNTDKYIIQERIQVRLLESDMA